MALTDILDKIQHESQVKVDQLKKNFDHKIAELKKEYEERKQAELTAISKKAADKAEMMKNKITILGKMEAKNILLSAKREMLEEAKKELVKYLADSGHYEKLLEKILKNVPKDTDGHVVAAKGKHAETKKAVKAAGLSCSVNEKEGAFEAGFIIRGGKVEFDGRFATIIETRISEELEQIFVSTLF